MSELGQGPEATPAPALPEGHGPMADAIDAAHDSAKAQLGKLKNAVSMVDSIRREMGELSKLGDMVTPEDVIRGAGALVGEGADPGHLAALLADMPQGGQAIQGWLSQHEQVLGQNEGLIKSQLGLARHALGVAAFHKLAMHHIETLHEQGAQAPQPVPNALEPSNG